LEICRFAVMILHLIRHPEPLIEPGICYGQLDILAKNVKAAAERLRTELPPDLPVWSSPLRRCRELAELLHPLPVFDRRLAEMDFGQWEGRPWDSIPRAELDAWAADIAGYAPPGGESPRQVQRRALDFVGELSVPEAVLVTHAGVIRLLQAAQFNLPVERWLEQPVAYAAHVVLDLGRPGSSDV
jgi:alpha-ribazole phosphatase